MAKVSVLALHGDYITKFEKSKNYIQSKEKCFLEEEININGHKAYLFNNNGIGDIYQLDIPDDLYFFLEIDNNGYKNDPSGLIMRGEWHEAIDEFHMNIIGAMSFIIKNISSDDSPHEYQKEFFSLKIVKKHIENLDSFFEKYGYPVDPEFFEDYNEESFDDEDENKQGTKCFFEIMKEQEYADLSEDVIKDINDQYALSKLNLCLSEDFSDEKTLVYTMEPDLLTFIKFSNYLNDDLLDDLESGAEEELHEFAYSLWTKSDNINLYEDIGLEDDGNFISYPTLYVGEYQGDPVSGGWESNS